MGQESRVAKDEFELSLELSIGGCYANSGNKDLEREKGRPHEDINREIPRSDFCGGENLNDKCEFPDVQRKREIQALKRREARMKREVKKSRGPNGVARAEERESREREGTPVPVPEESAAKRERTGAEKVNTSLFGENKVCGTQQQMQAQFLLPVGNGLACPWVVPFWGSKSNYVVAGEGDGQSSGENVAAAVAAAPCSSVVSHHGSTCTSNKGGSSSDSGSQSSSIEKQHGSKLQHLELDRINNTTTTPSDHNAAASTPPTTTTVVNTSPTPASQLHMPCVSTTGTKTITGFLYKYTKSEVSIMCVCHGSFFSPAQFVEHAGGVNVTNPLRHITVVPSLLK